MSENLTKEQQIARALYLHHFQQIQKENEELKKEVTDYEEQVIQLQEILEKVCRDFKICYDCRKGYYEDKECYICGKGLCIRCVWPFKEKGGTTWRAACKLHYINTRLDSVK